MGNLFSFLAGILVGVAVGLLYAPMSGEELRAEIKAEAEEELSKVEAEWNRGLKEINERLESTRREVMAYVDRAEGPEEEAAATEEETAE